MVGGPNRGAAFFMEQEMGKYIQQISTGIVFVSTDLLEKMDGMRPLKDSEANELLGLVEPQKPEKPAGKPAKSSVEPPGEGSVDGSTETTTTGTTDDEQPKTFQQLIEAASTKDQVEALVLKHFDKDIDRRKSLAALKAEALALG